MDWDGLRVFLAVVRAGRMSAAGKRLGIRHTTVSRRLAALEADLGVRLFYRTAGGHRLTPVGETILASAEAMERSAVGVGARARETVGQVAGRVRLALVPEFASHWLAPKLPAFRERHPQIDLEILVGTRQRDLSRGEADLAIGPRPRQAGLVAVRIGHPATGLYVSKTMPGAKRLRVEDAASLRGLPLLVYTAPFQVLQNARWFAPVLDHARVALETNSTHTLVAAAQAALGVAVLPHFVARHHDDLVCVSEDVAGEDVWLITHPEVRRDPKVRATTNFLRQVADGPDGLD